MNAATIQLLAGMAADCVETDGSPCTGVTMGECADGSRRHYALVTTYDEVNGLEQTYRVTTAAPLGGPRSRIWSHPKVEVKVGDGWMNLTEFADEVTT